MSEGVFADFDGAPRAAMGLLRLLKSRALPGIVMLTSSALFGIWVIYPRPTQPLLPETASQGPDTKPYGDLVVLSTQANRTDSAATWPDNGATEFTPPFVDTFPPDPFGALAGLRPSASVESLALRPSLDLDLESAPNSAEDQVAATPLVNAPLPPRRPADFGVAPTPAPSPSPAPSLAARDASPTQSALGFFERLFSGAQNPQGQAVAYANPETTTITRSAPQSAILRSAAPSSQPSGLARYDKFTAVYDIEARTVYLPNGSRLEAHSGLGELKDDPKHVDAHARGATPPDIYELGLRDGLFHGVQALRLKPVGSGEQFGRTGLLAHPYMLGAEGDSFGCVSFKDYDAFLQAFQTGQVKKLAVVAKLD